MLHNSHTIRWSQITSDTFMYGTHLHIDAHETYFENKLMPSGRIIHVWKMMTDYYSEKTLPQLPILKHGYTYRFTFDYDVEPEGHIYFKLIFKKRNGVEMAPVIIQSKVIDVTYPTEAFSYELQMINAAATSVRFRSIHITEPVETDVAPTFTVSSIMYENPDVSAINVIIVDDTGLTRDALQGLHNVVLVEQWQVADIAAIAECVAPLDRDDKLNFIGYTVDTNDMAYRLATQMGATAWVTTAEGLPATDDAVVNVYGQTVTPTMAYALVTPMFHASRQLRALDMGLLNGGRRV
ncbi:accessory Sec system protein Asp3 [Staphylococcus rostri]|uniref:Accessory Sec system protein Asp3 n=1 Tax=Staphylococcus rostri TaxID=522262 RepID=A0A2K3YPF1_9STAP|nr:accessory Sec system protein Asp3 [Staphylococcus rostri]PNZ27461.1 accessory Sec system protein Asp3 [Staphylococcus rostri]